jgi:hypothetical protein
MKNKIYSWSQLSTFSNPDYPEYSDPEAWYRRYVLKIKEPTKPVFEFGSKVDALIQTDPTFLPELERYSQQQFKLEVQYKGIKLIGYADHWDELGKRLADDKTGKQKWDKKRADQTTQLTMYVTMIYLIYKIKPENIQCEIRWLETEERGDFTIGFVEGMQPKSFKTKRTMLDVLKCLSWVEKTVKEMDDFVQKKLSTSALDS